jgi:hypothetical protein
MQYEVVTLLTTYTRFYFSLSFQCHRSISDLPNSPLGSDVTEVDCVPVVTSCRARFDSFDEFMFVMTISAM